MATIQELINKTKNIATGNYTDGPYGDPRVPTTGLFTPNYTKKPLDINTFDNKPTSINMTVAPSSMFAPKGSPENPYTREEVLTSRTKEPVVTTSIVPSVSPSNKTAQFGNYTYAVDAYGSPYGSPLSTTIYDTDSTTISDIARGVGYTFSESPEYREAEDFRNKLKDYYTEQFETSIDPSRIYQDTLSKYQGQIDAINNIYNDQINQARAEGAARLESRKFAQGRAGQIGSGTGEALINKVSDANREVENAINNERAAAISAIYAQIRNASAEDLAAKTKAKREGADALLAELNAAPERKKARINDVIAQLLTAGIDVNDMTPEELRSFTEGLGISEQEFIGSYDSAASAAEIASLKEQLEIDKTKAEISKLGGEEKQKALDRALDQRKIDLGWYNAQTSRLNAELKVKEDSLSKDELQREIRKQIATQDFKDLSKKQKVDYILSQGGDPADYGY